MPSLSVTDHRLTVGRCGERLQESVVDPRDRDVRGQLVRVHVRLAPPQDAFAECEDGHPLGLAPAFIKRLPSG